MYRLTAFLPRGIDPERQLEISRERRANLVPAEVLYSNNRSTTRHRVYEHYSHQRILCTNALVVLRDTRWEDSRQIIATMEVDLLTGTQLVYTFPDMILTVNDFQGDIARSAIYQELDLDDNWDIVSADFDDSSVYSISEGEGDTHQSISVMVQDTPVEETVFMAIEEGYPRKGFHKILHCIIEDLSDFHQHTRFFAQSNVHILCVLLYFYYLEGVITIELLKQL
ncbi:hypothetical protein Tco_1443797 [Tanacetum coccineum]